MVKKYIDRIDEALEKYNVCAIVGLFSGGHDSLTACHIASQHPKFTSILHIDTTTGLRETKDFVIKTCEKHKWQLDIETPFLPFTSLLMKWGFPGPALHYLIYERLKNRTISNYLKKLRKDISATKNQKIMLISGVRTQESTRRAEIKTEPHIEGTRLWLPIIHDFSAIDCNDYIDDNHLGRSPVKDILHMSGECFCGCFSANDELHQLKIWYPYQYERILKWGELVRTAYELEQWERSHNLIDSPNIKSSYCEYGGPKGAMPPEQMSFLPLCINCSNR